MTGILIVTGGSRGIGAATARLAAKEGYAVCISYRERSDAAERLMNDIRQAGGTGIAVQADTAHSNNVERLFETCQEQLGSVTHLVNNAGITGPMCQLVDLDVSELRRVVDVNLVGYFRCCQEAVRRMSTQRGGSGGAIVNVSSRAAVLGGPNEWIHYAATKGATNTLTVGLAREVGAQGIRINAVSPGLIETDIHASAGDPERVSRLTPGVPMQRPGSADEVATVILFLLSSAASYVNGSIVDVGGGR